MSVRISEPGLLGKISGTTYRAVWCGSWLILLAFSVLVGCAGTGNRGCSNLTLSSPGEEAGAISLELFQELPAPEQNRRRVRGGDLRALALRTPKLDKRLALLTRAVAVDPELAVGWLDLADILRWVGEDARTEAALTMGDRALKSLAATNKNSFADRLTLRKALLRAWFHYDRGEWLKGRRWAKYAIDVKPGSPDTRLIMGLLAARLGQASKARGIADDILRVDEFATHSAWINASLEVSRGLDREAFSFYFELRPKGIHAAECYRDMASTAERLGDWSFAKRWYRESASAIPLGKIACLTKVVHKRLAPGARAGAMPVWLGFDNAYATGSWSAYTALALEKFNQAPPGPDRDHWAGAVINAAGICLRLNLDRPWARRAKGLVFAATDHPDRARSNLLLASQELDQVGSPDALVEGELGRLLILREGYDEALKHLTRAVELAPRRARSWSDLGLVLVRSGDREGAGKALSTAIKLDPGLAVAWYNRGLLAMHMGNLDQAVSDLGKAATLAPENQDITNLLQRVEQARKNK